MKNFPALLILYALGTSVTGGAPALRTMDSLSLPGDYAGSTRVWQERLQQKVNVDSNGVVLKGYDVVAYFTQRKAIKGTAKYQTTYKRAIYYFSSAADLAAFKEHPSKYVPQYGGYCAYQMSQKKLVGSDPTVFFIVNEKLYLCSSPTGEKEFRSHEQENIKRTDQIWEGAWWSHENKS